MLEVQYCPTKYDFYYWNRRCILGQMFGYWKRYDSCGWLDQNAGRTKVPDQLNQEYCQQRKKKKKLKLMLMYMNALILFIN